MERMLPWQWVPEELDTGRLVNSVLTVHLALLAEWEEGQEDSIVGIQSPFEFFLLYSHCPEATVSFWRLVRGLGGGGACLLPGSSAA